MKQYIITKVKPADDWRIAQGHDNKYEKYWTLEEARAELVGCPPAFRVVEIDGVAQSVKQSAEKYNKSPADLAMDIYRTCERVQDELAGEMLADLTRYAETDETLNTYFIGDAICEGMIFASREGKVYVNKRKSYYNEFDSVGDVLAWQRQWVHVFGCIDDERVIDTCIAVENAIAEHIEEENRVVRAHDRDLELMPTFEVAHRMAVQKALEAHYTLRSIGMFKSNIYSHLAGIHYQEYCVYHQELVYRTKAEPATRTSLKRLNEARKDWATAAEYLSGERVIFDSTYHRAIRDAEGFDFEVDADVLPKYPPEKTPAKRKTEKELLQEVIRLAGVDVPADSFEREDIDDMMELIRRRLGDMRSEMIHG